MEVADLDWMQSTLMTIGFHRQTEMNPITITFAGINDHLHIRGFLSRLRDPTTAEAAVWTGIKDILETKGEIVEVLKEGGFQKIIYNQCLYYSRDMRISRTD